MTQDPRLHTQSSKELMDTLRQPAAIAAFEVARQNKWLTVDAQSLSALFAAEPNHPVREMLEGDAQTGGTFGFLQYAILMAFFGLAFGLTMFMPTMPPLLFFMWGALGVAAALLTRKHPKLIFGPAGAVASASGCCASNSACSSKSDCGSKGCC